jgi:TIR domain
MGKIFINYRRDDAISTAGRLHDRLAHTFGRNNLFMDVDHIPAGVDFVDYLHSQVAACDVFLTVIGPNWLDAKDDSGRRRFDNPDDFVTIEITAALARNIRVIPVLVDGARTPKADKLPDSVKPLVRRNAVELRNTQFGRDAEALATKVREALQEAWPATRQWPFLASAAAWLMVPGRWRMVAGATALLLVGWIGIYQMGVPVWVPWTSRAEQPDPPRVDKAKAAADAEAQRNAAEAEQQRQAKAAAEAEAKRQAAEAEQQRLAAVKADEERKAKAAAEAEAKRKAEQAGQTAIKALPAPQETVVHLKPLGCQAVHAASDRLRFDILPGTTDGLKAIQVKAWGTDIQIEDVGVRHVGDVQFASLQKRLFVASNTASAPMRLENDTKSLSLVLVTYSSATPRSSAPASLCIEGLK